MGVIDEVASFQRKQLFFYYEKLLSNCTISKFLSIVFHLQASEDLQCCWSGKVVFVRYRFVPHSSVNKLIKRSVRMASFLCKWLIPLLFLQSSFKIYCVHVLPFLFFIEGRICCAWCLCGMRFLTRECPRIENGGFPAEVLSFFCVMTLYDIYILVSSVLIIMVWKTKCFLNLF